MKITARVSAPVSVQYAAPMKVDASKKRAESTKIESFECSEPSGFGVAMRRLGDLALATTAGAGAGITAGVLPALSIIGIVTLPITTLVGGIAGAGVAVSMEFLQPGQISGRVREALAN